MAQASSARERGQQLQRMVYQSLVATARASQNAIPTQEALEAMLAARTWEPRSAEEITDAARRIRMDCVRGYTVHRALEVERARALWESGSRTCAWCSHPIRSLYAAEELGLALVHTHCAGEFADWANDGKSDAQVEAEQRDARREQMRASLRAITAGAPVMGDQQEDF